MHLLEIWRHFLRKLTPALAQSSPNRCCVHVLLISCKKRKMFPTFKRCYFYLRRMGIKEDIRVKKEQHELV